MQNQKLGEGGIHSYTESTVGLAGLLVPLGNQANWLKTMTWAINWHPTPSTKISVATSGKDARRWRRRHVRTRTARQVVVWGKGIDFDFGVRVS